MTSNHHLWLGIFLTITCLDTLHSAGTSNFNSITLQADISPFVFDCLLLASAEDQERLLHCFLLGHFVCLYSVQLIACSCLYLMYSTVVPPIYDPSDQRPPLVYDQFCYGRTKFVLQLPLVSDHLSNATAKMHHVFLVSDHLVTSGTVKSAHTCCSHCGDYTEC